MPIQSSQQIQGKVIQAGYDWSIRISLSGAGFSFPTTATFTSQLRRAIDAEDILATLTTANGGIVRVDETTLDIVLAGDLSNGWPKRKVYLDVVRTDLAEPEHLGFMLVVPVVQPVTRGLGA